MAALLRWCFFNFLLHIVLADFTSRNDIGGWVDWKTDSKSVRKYKGNIAENIWKSQQGIKNTESYGKERDATILSHDNVKLLADEPKKMNLETKAFKDLSKKRATKYDQQKLDNKEKLRNFEAMRRKKNIQKKNAENNEKFVQNKESSKIERSGFQTEQSEIKHLFTEKSLPETGKIIDKEKHGVLLNETVEKLNNLPHNILYGKVPTVKTVDRKMLSKMGAVDESENLIKDIDDYDKEIKGQKKNLWFQNLIPKSNKFIYNKEKHHEALIDFSEKKNTEQEKEKPATHHSRKKRDVLSSIYVQMPEEYKSVEGEVPMNDSLDKKSKSSTTVCLEIKSDPTKPPSTICGPEIKPNSPFSPQNMYSLGQNEPNSVYYTDPQPDKTMWGLNPLHDPMYYTSYANFRDQSLDREDPIQNLHQHNANKLVKEKSPAHDTYKDKTYQSKDNSMSQNNMLSVEDKLKTMKTMPEANYFQDHNGIREQGQISKSMLSENDKEETSATANSRNNFKDLDLNLDAEMASDSNVYVDPTELSYYPSDNVHTAATGFGNGFDSDQSMFYPFANYEIDGGYFKKTEQAAQDKSQSLLNEQPSNMEFSSDLGQETAKTNNPSPTVLVTEPRGAYEYNPGNPIRRYPYRPTTYPYRPPRRYPYRPNYEYYPYDQDCRSGRCRSAETRALDSYSLLPWQHLTPRERASEIMDMNTLTPSLEQFGPEESFEHGTLNTDPTFRGNSYSSGRPYPYKPYEYEAAHRYPYSSQPYRPYASGNSYTYDPNCRTADGRSCRDSEAESTDSNIFRSVNMQNNVNPAGLEHPQNIQFPIENEILGSPKLPVVAPPITPVHAPALACKVIHKPVLPLTPGIGGIGIGTGHYGGVVPGLTPYGAYGFNGIGTGVIFSGVGTHGIGGSHGLSHHHLLGASNPVSGGFEESNGFVQEIESGDLDGKKEVPDTRNTNTKLKVEEIKEAIKEKLRAAEEKLQSSKSSILEKINKNIVKEKSVTKKENKTDESDETPSDTEAANTFSAPTTVQLPTGGKITYNMNPLLRNIPMLLGSSLFGGALPGSSGLNFNTPLGGSLSYNSPFFSQSNFDSANVGSAPWYNLGQFRSVDISKCNCQSGSSTCVCPVINDDSKSLFNPPSRSSGRSIAGTSSFANEPYVSMGSPLVGVSPQTPTPAQTPCARNSGQDILESSLNVQLPYGTIVSPIQPYHSPVGISLRAPVLGSVQLQYPLNTQLYRSEPSPMVGFASLSEMKDRENQLKQNAEYGDLNRYGFNSNTYYEPIYKSNKEENVPYSPSSKRFEENTGLKIIGAPKLSSQKKAELKTLEQLPSKILTAKMMKPTSILKLPLPKPLMKSTSLRTAVNGPCT